MNKIFYFFAFLLLTFQIQAQQWDKASSDGASECYTTARSKRDQAGNTATFICKYNWNGISHTDLLYYKSSGDTIWKHKFIGLSITDIGFDNDGNIYFAGHFSDTIAIEDNLLISAGLNDAVIGKLNSKGELIHVRSFGSAANEFTGDLVISDDLIDVYGKFKNNFKIDAVHYEPDCLDKCFISFTKDLIAQNNLPATNTDLSILTNSNNSELDVYAPHADNNATVKIYNATGQLVLKENLSKNQFHANIAGVNQGVYSLIVQNADGSLRHDKFSKE